MTGTERKVFQKYYPPDFDPSKLPRAKQPKNRQWVQRVMTPFNMRCNTCNEYIYKGKKFNMKREPADEFYLGMRIWRFYFKCPNCLAEISFKTDLENCDYQAESGATRLFEAFKLWKDSEKAKEMKEEEDAKDPMKMLEKRTMMSRAEMEAMGKLEEMQELNRRHEGVDIDSYLESTDERLTHSQIMKRAEERDEEEVRRLFGRSEEGKIEKRIDEDEVEVKDILASSSAKTTSETIRPPPTADKKRINNQKELLSKLVFVKKAKVEIKEEEAGTSRGYVMEEGKCEVKGRLRSVAALTALADYSDSSNSDSD